MRDQSFLILIILLLIIGCNKEKEEEKIENDAFKHYGLKGDVLSIKATESEPTHSFQNSEVHLKTFEKIILFNLDGNFLEISNERWGTVSSFSKTLYDYDLNGKLIENKSYNYRGILTSKGIYKYDDEGREIEYTNYNGDGNVRNSTNKIYNDKGILVKEINIFGDDYEEDNFKYNNKGKLVEKTEQDGEKERYFYDKKGNLIKEESIYSFGNAKSLYKYDKKGNLIESILYNIHGEIFEKRTYSYDKNGYSTETKFNYEKIDKIIKKDSFNNTIEYTDYSSELVSKYFYEYEYDKYDNWTKKITKKGFKPISMTTREIVYKETKPPLTKNKNQLDDKSLN